MVKNLNMVIKYKKPLTAVYNFKLDSDLTA